MRWTRVARGVAIVFGLLTVAACGAEQSKAEIHNEPPFTFVWAGSSALRTPSFDMVRAAREAGEFTLTNEVFPGYLEAIKDMPPHDNAYYPRVKVASAQERLGTYFAKIYDATDSGDEISAQVCEYFVPTREYRLSNGAEPRTPRWLRITLTKRDTPPQVGAAPPYPPFKGAFPHQGQIPDWDVFDGWLISYMKPTYPRTSANAIDCAKWLTEKIPGLVQIGDKVGPGDLRLPVQQQSPRRLRNDSA